MPATLPSLAVHLLGKEREQLVGGRVRVHLVRGHGAQGGLAFCGAAGARSRSDDALGQQAGQLRLGTLESGGVRCRLPRRCARSSSRRSSAARSSGTPAPVNADASRTCGRLGRGRSPIARSCCAPTVSIARSCDAARSAPGRSDLLTTTMSATSSRPALIAWTSSPISGAWTTSVVSAIAATSTSLWPVPTVSMKISGKPEASRTAAAATVLAARPPA